MRLYVRLLDEDAPRWWDGGLEERNERTRGVRGERGGGDAAGVEGSGGDAVGVAVFGVRGETTVGAFQHAGERGGREDVRRRWIVSWAHDGGHA